MVVFIINESFSLESQNSKWRLVLSGQQSKIQRYNDTKQEEKKAAKIIIFSWELFVQLINYQNSCRLLSFVNCFSSSYIVSTAENWVFECFHQHHYNLSVLMWCWFFVAKQCGRSGQFSVTAICVKLVFSICSGWNYREKKTHPFVTTSLQLSEEGANFSSSVIYHAWRASPQNRHNVFTCLNLTDHITFLWDNHRQSVKSTPCSRGHNYKSSTVGSLIQAFLLLFSPPTATEHTTNWLRSNL